MKLDKKKIKKLAIILLIITLIMVPVILLDRVFPFLFVTRLRDTIEITSDDDFSKYDFPGNGSKENPIVIADLEIGTKNRRIARAYMLIDISNTSYHIIIENCCFIGGPYAIFIIGLRGGSVTIRNNSFFSVEHYIGLDGYYISTHFEILGASNINVVNNTFTGKSWAMLFSGLYNSIISDNTIISEGYSGLECYDCQNLTLEKNQIEGSIQIYDSEFLNFTDNVLFNSQYGLMIHYGSNISVIRNTFLNHTSHAIFLNDDTIFIEIFHNSFIENNLGGISQAQDQGINNSWHSILLLEGNYWSDLGSNLTYEIEGSAGSIDLYPIANPVT